MSRVFLQPALGHTSKGSCTLSLQAEEEMNIAKMIYEGINNDLKEELPVLYER